jgi:hypothetical protein
MSFGFGQSQPAFGGEQHHWVISASATPYAAKLILLE